MEIKKQKDLERLKSLLVWENTKQQKRLLYPIEIKIVDSNENEYDKIIEKERKSLKDEINEDILIERYDEEGSEEEYELEEEEEEYVDENPTEIKFITECPIIFEKYDKITNGVCFPTDHSVPSHLLNEFKNINNLNSFISKSKLNPDKYLPIRGKQFLGLLTDFWNLERLEYMCKILLKKVSITLTHIDWLCTNYSQIYPVKYVLEQKEGSYTFDLFEDHGKNLQLSTRKFFGVFCRHQRILLSFRSKELEKYFYPKEDNGNIYWVKKMILGTRSVNGKIYYYLITSFGQLLFFRWAFIHKVIDYCDQNSKKIKQHLKQSKNKPKIDGKRRKLCEALPSQPQIQENHVRFICDQENLRVFTMVIPDNNNNNISKETDLNVLTDF
jgi:hypothetical protein